MQGVQSLGLVGSVDDHRDVEFRGALSNGHHVDPVLTQCLEQAPRNTWQVTHVFTDDGYYREVFLHAHRINQTRLDFVLKFFFNLLTSLAGFVWLYRKTDRMFG